MRKLLLYTDCLSNKCWLKKQRIPRNVSRYFQTHAAHTHLTKHYTQHAHTHTHRIQQIFAFSPHCSYIICVLQSLCRLEICIEGRRKTKEVDCFTGSITRMRCLNGSVSAKRFISHCTYTTRERDECSLYVVQADDQSAVQSYLCPCCFTVRMQ